MSTAVQSHYKTGVISLINDLNLNSEEKKKCWKNRRSNQADKELTKDFKWVREMWSAWYENCQQKNNVIIYWKALRLDLKMPFYRSSGINIFVGEVITRMSGCQNNKQDDVRQIQSSTLMSHALGWSKP